MLRGGCDCDVSLIDITSLDGRFLLFKFLSSNLWNRTFIVFGRLKAQILRRLESLKCTFVGYRIICDLVWEVLETWEIGEILVISVLMLLILRS